MIPSLKMKWLEALRSGKYKQATGVLRREDTYCCLGVLADVVDSTKWKERYEDSGTCYAWDKTEPAYKLPDDILDQEVQAQLIEMNDDGEDFNRIAEKVESLA
jgi:hypothetical protein